MYEMPAIWSCLERGYVMQKAPVAVSAVIMTMKPKTAQRRRPTTNAFIVVKIILRAVKTAEQ